MALLPHLLACVTALSDTGNWHCVRDLCVYTVYGVFSEHTSVPVYATVLTADPCCKASQHILTAIPAYPFRSQGLCSPWAGLQSITKLAHTHTDGQPFLNLVPTGRLEPPISLACMSLDCRRKPEHLGKKKPWRFEPFSLWGDSANQCSITLSHFYNVIE